MLNRSFPVSSPLPKNSVATVAEATTLKTQEETEIRVSAFFRSGRKERTLVVASSLVGLAKPRVISITPNPSFLCRLLLPRFSLLSISDPPTKMEGKRAPRVPLPGIARTIAPRIPRNNTKISSVCLFSPVFSPFSVDRARKRTLPRCTPLSGVPLACLLCTYVYRRSYVSLRGQGTRLTGVVTLLFLTFSFLPAVTLIYSAHKRCSQITVPFMTLLLHRRTRSFLR